MPSIYAHDQFGKQVLSQLDDELKGLITTYKKAFQIGLQGPDIFSFYRPWKENDISEYTTILHEKPARYMFERGMRFYRNSAEYVYMIGVACHYALDCSCHPYIAQYEKETGVSHMELEAEFEKMLMRRTGKDPFSYRTELLIPADADTAETLYHFYHVFGEEKMLYTLRWTQNFRQLFTEPSPIRKWILNKLLTIVGLGNFKKQVLQLEDNPLCDESNETLYRISKDAIPFAVSLIQELDDCKQAEKALSEIWDKSFMGL